MQIPFTADFMYVLRLGIFSSILSSHKAFLSRGLTSLVRRKKQMTTEFFKNVGSHF